MARRPDPGVLGAVRPVLARRVAALIVLLLVALAPAAALASPIVILSPQPDEVDGGNLAVVARPGVFGTFLAQVGPNTGTLDYVNDPQLGPVMRGSVSLAGIAYGPQTLTVSDTSGLNTTAQVTFFKHDPPPVVVAAPLSGTVARPFVDVDVSCSDEAPDGTCSLTISARAFYGPSTPQVVAQGVQTIQTSLDLGAYEGSVVVLSYKAEDAAGLSTSGDYIMIPVDSSPALVEVSRAPMSILDFDDQRILYIDFPYSANEGTVGVFDRASQVVLPLGTFEAYSPAGCFLTPAGAICAAFWKAVASLHTFEWTGGTSIDLTPFSIQAQVYQAAGQYALFGYPPSLWVRDFSSETTTLLSAQHQGYGGAAADITATGVAVAHLGTGSENTIWALQGNQWIAATYPTSTPCGDPATDGTAVVSWCNDGVYLHTPTVDQRLGVGSEYYAVNGGYVAYSPTGTETWLRAPDGTAAVVAAGAVPDVGSAGCDSVDCAEAVHHLAVSDTGQVMIRGDDGRRYLAAVGAPLQPVSSELGTSRWFHGAWYVVMGRSLFRVEPPCGGALDGALCDDGDPCTQNDTCQGGVCISGVPPNCVASDDCHVAGTCDATTGECSNAPVSDGTPCPNGTCEAGICQPPAATGAGGGSTVGAGGASSSAGTGTSSASGPGGASSADGATGETSGVGAASGVGGASGVDGGSGVSGASGPGGGGMGGASGIGGASGMGGERHGGAEGGGGSSEHERPGRGASSACSCAGVGGGGRGQAIWFAAVAVVWARRRRRGRVEP